MTAIPTIENLTRWNDDYPTPDMIERFLAGYKDTCRLTTSELWRETQYKILHRAYTPYFYKGSKLKLEEEKYISRCPKCSTPKPTLKHCSWECSKIQAYWDKITYFLQRVTKDPTTEDPHIYFLNIKPQIF